MGIAALITWLLTAAGGIYMFSVWIAKGGLRRPTGSRFPAPLIFGHLVSAVIGLVLWIIYLVTDSDGLAWAAFIVLLPVALLGFVMLVRWIPTFQTRQHAASAATGTRPQPVSTPAGQATAAAAAAAAAEQHFPVAVVAGHGVFAVATVILVLLTALGIGGS